MATQTLIKKGDESKNRFDIESGGAVPAVRPHPYYEDLLLSIQRRFSTIHDQLKLINADLSILGMAPAAITTNEPTMEQITACVARHFGMTVPMLREKRNSQCRVLPRQMAQWLIYKHKDVSLSEIGRYFGQHHTSVVYGVAKFNDRYHASSEIRYDVSQIEAFLNVGRVK